MLSLESLSIQITPLNYYDKVVKQGLKMGSIYAPMFKSSYQESMVHSYPSELDLIRAVATATNYAEKFPEILTHEHNQNLVEGYPYKSVYRIVCELETA